ncbi:MAG: PAS domain-containing protein [Hymenobacter sp.]
MAVTRNNEVGSVAAAVNRVLRQAEDERRATLAELITQRNRTDSLVRGLDEGLLLIDQHGVIVLANPVACLLLGQPAKELLGQPRRRNSSPRTRCCASGCAPRCPPAGPTPLRPKPAGPPGRYSRCGRTANLHYQLTVSEVTELNEELQKAVPAGHVFCLRDVSVFKNLDQVKSEFLATISHELENAAGQH